MEPRRLGHGRKVTLFRRLCLAALLGLWETGLGAQEPAQRAALEQFRDSLARVTDTTALGARSPVSNASADSAAAALAQLRRGLLALRLGELGNARSWRRAEAAFNAARDLEPDWPWPRFGRALAKLGLSDAQRADPLELGLWVGVGALDDAVTGLTDALALDPSFEPALAELDHTLERLHRPDYWERGLAALRRAGARNRQRPAILLGLGRLEREVGSADSALVAFHAYLAAGGLPGLGRLEIARTRLANGLPGGDTAYYAGAAYDDSLTVREYRNDIAVILTDSQLVAFDQVRGADRAAYLHRFWEDRDRLDLRQPGERLAEHYRRLAYARKNFGLTLTRRIYVVGCVYRTGSLDFDDRGVIWIRQGEPTHRVRTYLFGIMPNESWRYARPDGDLIFHFGAGIGVDDYRVLSSVVDIFGKCAIAPNGTPVSVAEVYSSRAELDPMYAKLATWLGTSAGRSLAIEERRAGEASIAFALGTDSHERRFAHPLDAAISVATVGQEGNRSLVHVVYGIPGERLTGSSVNGNWQYPVTLRFTAYDAGNHVVASADTGIILFTPAAVAAGSMLFGRFAVPVPAGHWHYRLSLQQGDSTGVVTPRDSLVVPRFDAGLVMSDPVLGWRRISLTWDRGADTVFFSPFHSYFGATELELYYEVYGMTPGSTYQTDLLVSDKKGDRVGSAHVNVRFGGVAGEGVTSGRRTLDLQQFKPGQYWLELVVTDAAGRRQQRRTWFEVKPTPRSGR